MFKYWNRNKSGGVLPFPQQERTVAEKPDGCSWGVVRYVPPLVKTLCRAMHHGGGNRGRTIPYKPDRRR
jgi:hypothetical protein